ncbi:MAG: nucleotidyltransferase family protein [Bacteroidota bacterium]
MITAIILAAGQSRRMGRPKMLLPWGVSTVLQTVVAAFDAARVDRIVVVTGADREQVETLVQPPAQAVFNPAFAGGEMLSSIQTGLEAIKPQAGAALIGLGDQPQVQLSTIQSLLHAYADSNAHLIVPSYRNHRGHPWLVAQTRWAEIASLRWPQTMRDFFRSHAGEIRYVEVDNSSVLADLDTPEDYRKSRP